MKKKGLWHRLFPKAEEDNATSFNVLNSEEKEMIQGIVDLSQLVVREIMVPRTDTVFIDVDMPQPEYLKLIIETGYSRFPVYQDRLDNVIGILHVKDLLRSLVKSDAKPCDLASILKPAYFVPETKRLNSLLKEFKRRKVHIAVVIDEYGGTSGIVCLEDILEQIVGEIQDEFDQEPEAIRKIADGTYLCNGHIKLSDLNEKLKLDLPDAEFDSLSGFVFDLFGKIPEVNESVVYGDRFEFIVQRIEGRKILSVKIIIRNDENKKK